MHARPPTVLITGATAGIGRDAALTLAGLGHRVLATGRKPERLADLVRAAAAAGDTIETVELDVDDAASIAAAAAAVDRLTDGHGIDVLINNAGFAAVAPLVEMSDADLRAQFETNVFGLMAVTRAFVPAMMVRRAGRIINLSSSGGRISLPFVGAYHGAKFALEAMSDALRWELAPFGVHVVLIEPGPIRTEFAGRMLESTVKFRPDSAYAPIHADIPRIQGFAERQMQGPEVVTRAIVRAIEARRPRARYLMPRRVGVAIALFHLLPTCTADWLMGRISGLTRRRFEAA